MARTFELFHLSLVPKTQELFHFKGSREEWLRRALVDRFEFPHRSQAFHWVPKSADKGDIIGIVERQTAQLQHLPPTEGGSEVVETVWQGAIVIVDPSAHATGQRVAFEVDRDIGKPLAVLGSMLVHINTRHDAPYATEAKPVFDGGDFWGFAEKHGGVLRRITFDFVVPNMWGVEQSLDKELQGTGKDTGAQKVKVSLESTDGVSTNNDRVKAGVAYSERGGGSLTAKSLDGDSFSSTKKIKTTKVPSHVEKEGNQTAWWRRLAKPILGAS